MPDLDGFKEIDDRFGYDVGDADAARMSRGWFTGAFEAMGGQLRAAMPAAEPRARSRAAVRHRVIPHW